MVVLGDVERLRGSIACTIGFVAPASSPAFERSAAARSSSSSYEDDGAVWSPTSQALRFSSLGCACPRRHRAARSFPSRSVVGHLDDLGIALCDETASSVGF